MVAPSEADLKDKARVAAASAAGQAAANAKRVGLLAPPLRVRLIFPFFFGLCAARQAVDLAAATPATATVSGKKTTSAKAGDSARPTGKRSGATAAGKKAAAGGGGESKKGKAAGERKIKVRTVPGPDADYVCLGPRAASRAALDRWFTDALAHCSSRASRLQQNIHHGHRRLKGTIGRLRRAAACCCLRLCWQVALKDLTRFQRQLAVIIKAHAGEGLLARGDTPNPRSAKPATAAAPGTGAGSSKGANPVKQRKIEKKVPFARTPTPAGPTAALRCHRWLALRYCRRSSARGSGRGSLACCDVAPL